MKKLDISDFKDTVRLGAARTGVSVKEHLPEIIFVVCTSLLVKGVVKACKVTPDFLDDYHDRMEALDMIKQAAEDGEITEKEELTETAKEYAGLSKDFFARYGVSTLLVGAAVGGYGYAIWRLKKENKELKGALADFAIGLMAYRGRVAKAVGADKEFDLFHNIKRGVEEKEYTDEKGKKKKRKEETVNDISEQVPGDHNSYFFGIGDAHHTGNKYLDRAFMIDAEMMLNRQLVGRGHGGHMRKAEVTHFMKWDKNDPYKLIANDWGWVYNKYGDYEYYKDPITGKSTDLPRIIKLTCSPEFMDEDNLIADETWVELNSYPIRPILAKMQNDILNRRADIEGSKYIATIPGVA